ncbi:MAG TPA: hypothetical protein VKQ31_01330 [Steroidobacteraceae bacterium]|nr:hypothetical protein [Steroidobacteraceae bacterium]
MSREAHWEGVYRTRPADQVSWYRPHLETSLRLIEEAQPDRNGRIIDVGGGAATLVAATSSSRPSARRGRPVAAAWRSSATVRPSCTPFGAPFVRVKQVIEMHRTPAGAEQQFLYCLCKRSAAGAGQ